jgi:hypothetical protein
VKPIGIPNALWVLEMPLNPPIAPFFHGAFAIYTVSLKNYAITLTVNLGN